MKFMIDVILPAEVREDVSEYSVSYVEEGSSSAEAIRLAIKKTRDRFSIGEATLLHVPVAWAVMPNGGLTEVFGLVA